MPATTTNLQTAKITPAQQAQARAHLAQLQTLARFFKAASGEEGARVPLQLDSTQLEQEFGIITILEKLGCDGTVIYCCKTGQPVGMYAKECIAAMHRIYKVDKSVELLHFIASTQIAPHWLRTDSASLDKLIAFDPRGYFVYAMAILNRHHATGWNLMKGRWDDYGDEKRYNLQKIALYEISAHIDAVTLGNVNEQLRVFLSLINPKNIPAAIVWPWPTLLDAANVSNWNEICNALHRIAAEYLRKVFHVGTRALSYYDILALGDKSGGMAPFRGQHRPIQMSTADIIKELLHDLDLGEDIEYELSKSVVFNEPQRRKKYAADIHNFGSKTELSFADAALAVVTTTEKPQATTKPTFGQFFAAVLTKPAIAK